jgi:hypothetical protein
MRRRQTAISEKWPYIPQPVPDTLVRKTTRLERGRSLEMADSNDALNRILVRLYRSLLQYMGESWPWTGVDEEREQQVIEQLVREQKAQVATLVDLLNERGHAIDFGQYPDNSEYHYVALDFVLERIIRDEQAVLAAVQQAKSECDGDATGLSFLEQVELSERTIIERLMALAAGRRQSVLIA